MYSLTQLSEPAAETLNVTSNIAVDRSEVASHQLRLTFDENVDSETLRAAFVETGAYIVSGPDSEGRYIVEVEHEGADILASMSEVAGVKYVSLVE